MQLPRRNAAFTLIELVVVLGIVAILVAIAIATTVGNRPRQRLVAASSDLRLKLLETRTMAVKSGRNYKVCIFRDDDPTVLPPHGRIVTFACGEEGMAACAGATVCNNETANPGADQWSTTEVDCADVTKWCQDRIADWIDLNDSRRRNDAVSVNQFYDASNTASPRDSIELTFMPSGSIDRARSTMGSGSIELTNHDQCLPSPDNCTGGFTNRYRVAFTTGGGARLLE